MPDGTRGLPLVVDRIEGDVAVVEVAGRVVELPVAALPPGTGEGAVLRLVPDPDTEQARLDEAQARLERLKRRTPPKKVLDL